MSAALSRRPPPCVTRIGILDDLAFVVDSWAKNAPSLKNMRTRDAVIHVRALLSRDATALVIAHVPDEPDAILGWAAVEQWPTPCVHYVYVRRDGRRQGVARAMLEHALDAPQSFSPMTPRPVVVEYSHKLPKDVVLPSTWILNLKRAET